MIKTYLTKNLTNTCIAIILIGSVFLNFSHHNWLRKDRVISWDVKSYYAYLPATFIYKDLSLQFRKDNMAKFGDLIWPVETPTNKQAIVTTMGLSILYAPFFGIAHGYCLISEHQADGYSMPYKFTLVFSSLFYVIWGLIFLKKILQKYFDENIVAFVVTAIGIGTNLFHYYTYRAPMPHAYNFALITLFIYKTIEFYENPSKKKIFWLGLLSGLIVLIRPTNIIILILFFLWNISSFKDLKTRITYFLKDYKLILIMFLGYILIWIPQFTYWYWISGKLFYFSYGELGGKFFFLNPQIKNVLISYKKGWFVYTPIMFFACMGIFTLPKHNKGLFLPIIVFTILNIYIISSWWCWWYGGSFGQRALIDSYGLMAIPLASFLQWSKSKKITKYLSFVLIGILIIFNIFQIQQFKRQAIHYWWMNKESYWETFLKLDPTERYWEVITIPDYEKAREGIYVEIKPNRKKKEIKTNLPSKEKIITFIIDEIKNDSIEYLNIENEATSLNIEVDSLLNKTAEIKYRTYSTKDIKELIIENLVKSISDNKVLLKQVEEKAQNRNISLDSMLILDAIWLYENNKY
ncbi:MAG: hypothetical protein GQ564_12050 [Bacteroidales bacterium]|nr:hypothetical protein [Bacteroidales bacterium]